MNEATNKLTVGQIIDAAPQYLRFTSDAKGRVQNVELRVNGRWHHGLSHVRPGDEGRQVQDGPMVPGPWSYAFGLCTSLTSSRVAKLPVVDVETGDVLSIDGINYRVLVYRQQYIALERIEADGTLVRNKGLYIY